jgi:hypothetical protein
MAHQSICPNDGKLLKRFEHLSHAQLDNECRVLSGAGPTARQGPYRGAGLSAKEPHEQTNQAF